MPENVYTASYLLASLKRRGMLPATAEALSDEDYLAFLNEELQTYILPLLLSVREKYLLTEEDVPVVAGQAGYDIPYRAVGRKLDSVLLKFEGDVELAAIREIEPHRASDYGYEGSSGSPEAYYLRDDQIVLVPTPTGSSGTLRLNYFRRPSRLVLEDEVVLIESYDPETRVVSAAFLPSTFNSSDPMDVVAGVPGFVLKTADNVTTDFGIGVLTLSATPARNPSKGDYLAFAETSPIPQIPVELFPLLSQRVVVRALEALGDTKVQIAEQTSERMKRSALTLLTPRVEQSHRIIINRNAPGFGRNRWRF